MSAIIDTINYLGTDYDIADATARASLDNKATVPSGGTDGQVMIKKGNGFEWGLPGAQSNDIVAYGSYMVGATTCSIAIEIPSEDNYSVQFYSSEPNFSITNIDKTSTQIIASFGRQTKAGSICVVARKVG